MAKQVKWELPPRSGKTKAMYEKMEELAKKCPMNFAIVSSGQVVEEVVELDNGSRITYLRSCS